MVTDHPMQRSWTDDWRAAVRRAPLGFVLLQIVPGTEHETFQQIQEIKGVLEVYHLAGDYDIIVKIACEDVERDASPIVRQIRRLGGVQRTETLLTCPPK